MAKALLTLINHEKGVSVIVTQVTKGFAVSVLDLDVPEGLVGAKVFQHKAEAFEYAWRCV